MNSPLHAQNMLAFEGARDKLSGMSRDCAFGESFDGTVFNDYRILDLVSKSSKSGTQNKRCVGMKISKSFLDLVSKGTAKVCHGLKLRKTVGQKVV